MRTPKQALDFIVDKGMFKTNDIEQAKKCIGIINKALNDNKYLKNTLPLIDTLEPLKGVTMTMNYTNWEYKE